MKKYRKYVWLVEEYDVRATSDSFDTLVEMSDSVMEGFVLESETLLLMFPEKVYNNEKAMEVL